jgi:glycosyltransferase involved in cell wall biosynthesis
MARIVYVVLSSGGVAGGQKVCFRHVEALREFGYDAVVGLGAGSVEPAWFEHVAPVERDYRAREGDIVVVPDDSPEALASAAGLKGVRVVVFSQNVYALAASGGVGVIVANRGQFQTIMTVSTREAAQLRRLLPWAEVDVVQCFADERLFAPRPKEAFGVVVPRKRLDEMAAIRRFHRLLRPDHRLKWAQVERAAESRVAETFGRASIYLSLSRLESVGMTTLEAMASGCLCAGFSGVGGDQYATPENGFWAPEDDCFAAAEALSSAIDLLAEGGPRYHAMLQAGHRTARAWSHALFRDQLQAFWGRMGPEARG